jgi:hypothetical protein
MGQRDIRRLLITGAMAVVRWAARKGAAGVVAGAHAGQEAAPGRGDCSGEQDGPLGLGDAQQGRRISRISAGGGLTAKP